MTGVKTDSTEWKHTTMTDIRTLWAQFVSGCSLCAKRHGFHGLCQALEGTACPDRCPLIPAADPALRPDCLPNSFPCPLSFPLAKTAKDLNTDSQQNFWSRLPVSSNVHCISMTYSCTDLALMYSYLINICLISLLPERNWTCKSYIHFNKRAVAKVDKISELSIFDEVHI